MVVDDLYIMGAVIIPSEADTPLVVDPDTHLPCAIGLEDLEPVTRRVPEILDSQ